MLRTVVNMILELTKESEKARYQASYCAINLGNHIFFFLLHIVYNLKLIQFWSIILDIKRGLVLVFFFFFLSYFCV